MTITFEFEFWEIRTVIKALNAVGEVELAKELSEALEERQHDALANRD